MPYYTLSFGLNSSFDQTKLIQVLKSDGGDAIQSSNGLHVKSDLSPADFKAWLADKKLGEGVQVEAISKDKVLADPDAANDLKLFLES